MGIAIAKFIGFLLTGASSMLAEAVHSVADSTNQGLLFLGGNKAKRAPDPDHPFGYGRERYFWSFVVAVIIFTAGSMFALYEGEEKLRHPHELESPGPFPAGGPTDVNMRIIGQKLSENLRPERGDREPAGRQHRHRRAEVAKSPADGYTLLAAMDSTMVMNPATGTSMNYDPFKDFATVTLTAKNTSLLTVRAEDGPKTIQELIARGKATRAS